ncbi:phosphate ABC transporter substrate-binding protein PstS [Oerskovia flava]|uniref:phosphate ABC transporter substrate-binding protein PstS n=1 Tax=Oerskovia flava TaxID=2986422 RepID=UPI00223F4453|nr:phosphate ABC transporter substrate-binding protein PstS [Oerskovia sp. JB1-3-2]
MKLSRFSRAGSAVVIGALALTLAACGSDDPVGNATGESTGDGSTADTVSDLSGELNGAGASSQEAAMNAWRAGFQSLNADVTVNYDPVGSGGGRTQFVEGGVSFAGSDAALDEEEFALAQERCMGDFVEVPLYVSPIAVIYNLPEVEGLQMSGETLAGVFNGDITSWDDPAIAADNEGVELPSTRITPVNRSDESGTTENFTEYLAAAGGDAWPHDPSGDWPVQGGQSAQGTSGVVQTVQGGEGTIGYADASQAGSLGTVAIGVGEDFVPYSPEAAAAIVDASPRLEGRGAGSLALELDRDTDAEGTYPIVLVSYSLACLQYADEAEAELVKSFLGYVASEEGQQQSASAAGSAPISAELRGEIETIVEQISAS